MLYNGPDASPPESFHRVRLFIYACGAFATEEEGKKVRAMAGAQMERTVGEGMAGGAPQRRQ